MKNIENTMGKAILEFINDYHQNFIVSNNIKKSKSVITLLGDNVLKNNEVSLKKLNKYLHIIYIIKYGARESFCFYFYILFLPLILPLTKKIISKEKEKLKEVIKEDIINILIDNNEVKLFKNQSFICKIKKSELCFYPIMYHTTLSIYHIKCGSLDFGFNYSDINENIIQFKKYTIK